jgi:tetratricopeptide (TPR) repeat protein
VPPGRYSVQPDARSNSSSPPGGLHGNFDSALITLMDELSNGSDVQRWSAARLREALEQDAAGQIQQAIATLQAVMAQLSDPRIRVERDRLLARSLKATSGVYRARALTAERACQHKEAAASWSKVLEASPDDSEAAIHAATCSMEAGEISQAGVFARRAVELEPKSVTAHRLLLRFFRKTGMELNANREREILRQLAPKG